jgi:hypothetical protein
MAFGAAGLRARAGDDLETAQLLCAVSSLQSQLREAAEGRRATAAAVAERQTVVDALQARLEAHPSAYLAPHLRSSCD